jgi:hypothetical protein
MEKIKKNDKVCINVINLYDNLGLNIGENLRIDPADDGYYDLIDDRGMIVCMEGEICRVVIINDRDVLLYNKDSEKEFTLTINQFKIAICNN